jgi:glycosyltransferase involved in cell wall biosynthesis
MRIMIVTDAWFPQTNGVVRTLSQTAEWLRRFGHDVRMLTPQDFRSIACPTYPEIRLSLLPRKIVARSIAEFSPQALHIATEGPLGLAARRYCQRHQMRFTTSYHTQFPQYLRARFPIPVRFSYWALHRFHGAAVRCMVSTQSLRNELGSRGFRNLATWQRGVDTDVFKPGPKDFLDLPRPIAAYVGRVAVEKNIEAFLSMPWEGSKIVIGDGPERRACKPFIPMPCSRVSNSARTGQAPGSRRHHGVPESHRHLRAGESRSHGLRRAGGRLPGQRSHRRHRNGVTGALDTDLGRPRGAR